MQIEHCGTWSAFHCCALIIRKKKTLFQIRSEIHTDHQSDSKQLVTGPFALFAVGCLLPLNFTPNSDSLYSLMENYQSLVYLREMSLPECMHAAFLNRWHCRITTYWCPVELQKHALQFLPTTLTNCCSWLPQNNCWTCQAAERWAQAL